MSKTKLGTKSMCRYCGCRIEFSRNTPDSKARWTYDLEDWDKFMQGGGDNNPDNPAWLPPCPPQHAPDYLWEVTVNEGQAT